jgi:hypothetical protein
LSHEQLYLEPDIAERSSVELEVLVSERTGLDFVDSVLYRDCERRKTNGLERD